MGGCHLILTGRLGSSPRDRRGMASTPGWWRRQSLVGGAWQTKIFKIFKAFNLFTSRDLMPFQGPVWKRGRIYFSLK